MTAPEQAFQGFQPIETFGSQFNSMTFMIKSILAGTHTAAVVQVVKCSNTGTVSAVGTVDVTPMVNQLDGFGNKMPHGVIYSCPYFRLQGGKNAIIMDPEKGDIGIAIFSERDISNVIKTKKIANPASARQFSMADGMYIGGILNAVPQQYVQFVENVGGIIVNGEVYMNQSLNVAANVTVGNGASGTFTSAEGLTITVQDGIVTNIF